MNIEQKKLYTEWQRLENATKIEVRIASNRGVYGPVKSISPKDMMDLDPIREQVWKELRKMLTLDERVNLGQSLNKTIDETYNMTD